MKETTILFGDMVTLMLCYIACCEMIQIVSGWLTPTKRGKP